MRGGLSIEVSFVISIYLALVQSSEQLEFTSVQIPSLVQRGSNFWLTCEYKLHNRATTMNGDPQQIGDQLYSVKWYKNNEEFYRLLLLSANEDQVAGSGAQRHYFPQSGVNVLMSSSNATHVRLLNASLETEGLYACEISTQNLSTIRYEKEIRVYVAPQTRLAIIGFRQQYSLGDTVDLICGSDFSRPEPALGWFINNKRITQSSGRWFELSVQRRPAEQTDLFKSTLGLKFKLSAEFLAANSQRQVVATDKLDQSTGNHQRPSAVMQPIELQCRYKLTGISDVTYSEMVLGRDELLAASNELLPLGDRKQQPAAGEWRSKRGMSQRGGGELEDAAETNAEEEEEKPTDADAEPTATSGSAARWIQLQKWADNKVTQSENPAKSGDLRRTLRRLQAADRSHSSCRLKSLVLLPEDPLIVDSGLTHNRSADVEPVMSVNCTTIGALLAANEGQLQQQVDRAGATMGDGHQSADGPMFAARVAVGGQNSDKSQAAATRRRPVAPEVANQQRASSMEAGTRFCGDNWARRQLLISGRHQQSLVAGAEQQAPAQNQRGFRPTASNRSPATTSVAYLTLDTGNSSANEADHYLGQGNTVVQAATTRYFAASTGSGSQSAADATNLRQAPPLLEWFINNRETPRLSYSPELPVKGSKLLRNAADGQATSTGSGDQSVAPPIDYAEYFANFEGQRSQLQHLALNLKLNKKLFMEPDSKLRLQCSSTQAQVLVSEVASVFIVPLARGQTLGNLQQTSGWQQKGRNLHPNRIRANSDMRQQQISRASTLQNPGVGLSKNGAHFRSKPELLSSSLIMSFIISILVTLNT